MKLCLLLLALVFAGYATAEPDAETEAEIERLLQQVAGSGCEFQRNGRDHDAASAAQHLRLKLHNGSRYVNSTEQFIDRLATRSSWSGKAYTVTCEGNTQPSGEWLHTLLEQQRSATPDATP